MHLGMRHQLLRRRGKIPPPNRPWHFIFSIDVVAYAVSFSGLIFTMDQARIIWFEHEARGVSLVTWLFYVVSSAVWFTYGYIHKDNVIFITNMFWIAINAVIVIGIVLYGGQT